MKIAITGATGFIGRHLAPALREVGHDVLGLGRDRLALERLGASGVQGEMTDYSPDDLERLLAGVDAVAHLAGRRSSREDDPLAARPFLEANVGLLDSLMAASRTCGVGRVVLASTIAVYSPSSPVPYREDETVLSLNPYGLSKATAEGLLDIWGRRGDIRTSALRLAAGFGHGERVSAVLMRFIDNASRGEPLVVRGNRNIGVDQIYIRDIVGAFMAALEPDAPQGRFNIGAGRAYTLGEMALAVDAAFGGRSGVRFEDDPTSDATAPYMNIEAASQSLGWRPQWPLERALTDLHDTWRASATPSNRDTQ